MDGITYLCPRKDINKVNKVKEEMTNLTGLYIEDNIYTKFVVRDVKVICVVTRWIAGNLSKILILYDNQQRSLNNIIVFERSETIEKHIFMNWVEYIRNF